GQVPSASVRPGVRFRLSPRLVGSPTGALPLARRWGRMNNGSMRKPSPAEAQRADFEALYQRHSREVWALAYARWMNADTALDITQETFLRLWKQWETGEAIVNPRAWLLRVARNLAEDYAKSAFRRNGTNPPQTMNGV